MATTSTTQAGAVVAMRGREDDGLEFVVGADYWVVRWVPASRAAELGRAGYGVQVVQGYAVGLRGPGGETAEPIGWRGWGQAIVAGHPVPTRVRAEWRAAMPDGGLVVARYYWWPSGARCPSGARHRPTAVVGDVASALVLAVGLPAYA